jgi:hypothetical protein
MDVFAAGIAAQKMCTIHTTVLQQTHGSPHSHRRLKQIAVSDREGLEGLHNSGLHWRCACQQTIGTTGHGEPDTREGAFCDILFQAARKSLILKRRDGGVVDRARLENDCGDSRQAILKHLLS